MEIKNKKILVTGGNGFLGKKIIDKLISLKIKKEDIFIPKRDNYDLRIINNVEKLFLDFKPEIVIHLATVPGGMAYYKEHPGKTFYDNLTMGLNIIEISKRNNVEKVIITGTSLSYPENAPAPYNEKDFWTGYPSLLEAPYGMASKILVSQAESYKKEYGLNTIYLILPSLYGPGDHFDDLSHVIPTMIKKFNNAKEKKENVELWGTGNAQREFLYINDAASFIIAAIKLYDSTEPLNLGSGEEISIKELAEKISGIIKFKGKIIWDQTKPEGRIRRALDSQKAKNLLKIKTETNLDLGLKETINWFNNLN